MAGITLSHVTKRWGGVTGVADFSLEIADREFVVLLGPSGCGKTTTMRMIAGLEETTSGQIRIGDRVVNDVAARHRDIAMVFQGYGLYPNLNVYENIRYPLRARKVPKAEHHDRILRAAAMVELEDLLYRRPSELSGGQKQRVALARAVVREPNAFLMDEPLSNLDAKLRVTTRTQIKDLHRRLQTTTIYVTHDQIEAMTLADRVVVMHGGEIQQIGTPGEIYDRPANTFVASFIGTPAMNLIEGTVRAGQFTAPGVTLPASGVQDGAATLGFRAEDVTLTASGPVTGTLEQLDNMGDSALLHVSLGETSVILRGAKGLQLPEGAPVGADIAATNLHYFDTTTGKRLSHD